MINFGYLCETSQIMQSILVPTEEGKRLAYLSYATELDNDDNPVTDSFIRKLRSRAMIKTHVSSTNDVQMPMNMPILPTVPPISPPTFEGEDATPP